MAGKLIDCSQGPFIPERGAGNPCSEQVSCTASKTHCVCNLQLLCVLLTSHQTQIAHSALPALRFSAFFLKVCTTFGTFQYVFSQFK